VSGPKGTREDRWLSVKEAAAYLGCSVDLVYEHAAALGARRLGTRLMFKPGEIDRRLEVLDPNESISPPKTLRRSRKTDTDTGLDSGSHPDED
jgi:excisionase family DNA binding protein